MSGPPFPSRDPGVYSRPGAASVRPAAMWDAIYELATGNVIGITPEGAQLLVDNGIAAHEAKSNPHPVYVTFEEGDERWGASSGLSPHTHTDAVTGGVIDYLRTQWGTDHVNPAGNPHTQYTRVPAVQAMIDASLANYYTKVQADTAFLTQAEGDLLYLPIGYAPPPPDLSGYYTKAQTDARYLQLTGGALSGALAINSGASVALTLTPNAGVQHLSSGAQYFRIVGVGVERMALGSDVYVQPNAGGMFSPYNDNAANLGGPSNRWSGFYAMVGTLSTSLTVASKAVALSLNANQTLQWLANGFFSDAPTKATYDALVARVVTLEAQVASLIGQMGPGANGHYHLMGTWRQTLKPTLPATVLETQETPEEAVNA